MFWPPAGGAFDTWAACFVHKKSATLIRRVAAADTMEDTVSSQFAEAQVCSKSEVGHSVGDPVGVLKLLVTGFPLPTSSNSKGKKKPNPPLHRDD